jgi:hypothetical protein
MGAIIRLIRRIPATWTIIALLGLSLYVVHGMYQQERAERIRLSDNQEVLFDRVNGVMQTYKVRDSLNAARVDALNVTVSEFRDHFREQTKLINDMGVKINRLQSVSTMATETEHNIITTVRDSLVLRDAPETIQRINYADPWLSFSGVIDNKQLTASFQSRDTLIQVIHRVPHKFLFFRYGTKGVRQEVVSKNPYSRITYNELLMFQ